MWCRAKRVDEQTTEPFAWTQIGEPDHSGGTVTPFWPQARGARSAAEPAATPTPEQQAQLAALEREAFTKGYAQGERAGLEAGGKRADAMLRRVAQTIDQLSRLRQRMVHETERELVALAITLARRVVTRELTIAPDLVAALAHVALEKIGDTVPATIRLNPDDYSIITAARGEQWAGGHVTIVPDAAVARGGCLVESGFGVVDAGADAQFDELSRAVLGDPQGADILVDDIASGF